MASAYDRDYSERGVPQQSNRLDTCMDGEQGPQCSTPGQFVGLPRETVKITPYSASSDRYGTPTEQMDMQEADVLTYAMPTVSACGVRSAQHRPTQVTFNTGQA